MHLFEHVEKWPATGEQEMVMTASEDLTDAFVSLQSMYPSGSRSRMVVEEIAKIPPPGESKSRISVRHANH